jgi:hypothetical protein
MQTTLSLTEYEVDQVRRRCRGAAFPSQPAGFNRKPFLVRLLKEACPTTAAKIKRLTAREVDALWARLTEEARDWPARLRRAGALPPAFRAAQPA